MLHRGAYRSHRRPRGKFINPSTERRRAMIKLNATTHQERIDEFKSMVAEGKLSSSVGVLAECLRNSLPASEASDETGTITSAGIRDMVSASAELTVNEVTEVMTALEYPIFFDPVSGPLWCVK